MQNKNEIFINLSRKLQLKSHVPKQMRGCTAIPAFVLGLIFLLLGLVLLYNFFPELINVLSIQPRNIEDLVLLTMIVGTGLLLTLGFGYSNLRKSFILFTKAHQAEWLYQDDLQKLYKELIHKGMRVKGRIISINSYNSDYIIITYVFQNTEGDEIQGDFITLKTNKDYPSNEIDIIYIDDVSIALI
jgi:hypothetical protein